MQVNECIYPHGSKIKFNPIFLLLLLGLALSARTRAQVLYGSLTGIVTDPNGRVLAGANAQAAEQRTGVIFEAATDRAGIYRFTTLLPGTYQVTISAPNFATQVTPNVGVNANSLARVDAKLEVAPASETLVVSTQALLLQTDRSDVHTDINEAMVQSLPAISSEGKSFQELYKIVPGAGLPFESNSAGGNPQRAMTSNVNGQSSQQNDTRIDGVEDLYPWLPNNIAYVPPEDSIETVNIATNSFDAELGTTAGAWVNVETKSGTNEFHGDLHELYTGNALSNINYFNPPGFRNPLNVFNQFGGAIGGPVKKDKLFFFGDWESTRQVQAPQGNFQTVPFGPLTYQAGTSAGYFDFGTLVPAGVNIYDPMTGNPDGTGRSVISCDGVQNRICLDRVDPAALKVLSLIPAPNVAGAANSNNYFVEKSGFFHRDNFDAKVNYIPSMSSSIFGRYSLSRTDIFDPPALGAAGGSATLGGQNGNAFSRIQVVGLGGTYAISPNLLLDVNAGYTRQRINAEDTDIAEDHAFGLNTLHIPGTNDCFTTGCTSGIGNQLYWGIPGFQFNTFSSLGNANTGNPFLFRDNQYVNNVNMTWGKGKHQIRYGMEFGHVQLNHFQPQGGTFQTARGTFQFLSGVATQLAACTPVSPDSEKCAEVGSSGPYNSFAAFLLGLPDNVGKAVQNANTIALRWSTWAWYIRDQYQLAPNLTVTYGLRWEYYPMAYSDIGGARVLDPQTMQVLVGGGATGIRANDGVNVHSGLFLPRLGLSYRPLANTVIRADYGISADPNNWRFLRNSYPADTISSFSGASYPQALNSGFAPGGSLTGLNAIGPYSYLPAGIPAITIVPNAPQVLPLPNNVTTTTTPMDFRRGYINTFNLTLEQQFSGFVADVGYVGDRGIRPLTNLNINPAPGGGGQGGRILNTRFGGNWPDISELTPFGNNYYDSLQAKLTRPFGRNSQIGFAYTFSKAIDQEDDEEINNIFFPYPEYWPRNKALAGFDRTHNFEAYGLYAFPFGHGQKYAQSGILSELAGGWQLNWVLSAMSGTPFSIIDSGTGASNLDAPGNTQTVNIVDAISILNKAPKPSCSNLSCDYFNPNSFQSVKAAGVLGNAGRNILRGPRYFNFDASLMRNFKISERFTFQLEADAFSLTNTPHFNNPVNSGSNADLNQANFGAITSTLVTTNASLGGSGGQRQWWFGGKLLF